MNSVWPRGLLYFGFAMVAATNAAPAILVPFFAHQWGLSNTTVALLFPFFAGGAAIGGAFAGRMIVAHGYVRTIGLGYVMQGLGSLLLAYAGWPWALLAVGVAGGGLGLQGAGTNLVVAGWYPNYRGQALNLLNVVFSIGAISAGPAISTLIRWFGASHMLLGYGVGMLALAIVVLRRRWSEPPHARTSSTTPSGSRDAWLEPLLWLTVLLSFLYCGVETALNGWVVVFAQGRSHLPAEVLPLLPSMLWGAVGIGRLIAPLLISRWSGPVLISAFALLCAMGISIMLASAAISAAAFITGVIVAGFGLSLIFPTVVANYAATVRASGAATTGSLFAAASSGGAVIPWMVGAIFDYGGGLPAGFVTLILVCLSLVACQALINRSRVTYLAATTAETR